MNVVFQALEVATGSDDREGMLVLSNDRLIAVLVRLSNGHGANAGMWFLEHGFGLLDTTDHPVFADLHAVKRWVLTRLS